MKKFTSFGFIGGGRVVYFLLKALQQKNALPGKIIIADPNEASAKKVKRIAPDKITITAENKQAAQADVIFLAVHPPLIKEVLPQVKEVLPGNAILISLAPMASIEKLSAMLSGYKRIVRIIPNASSLINQGYNPVVFGTGISTEEKRSLHMLFQSWGQVPEVQESKLEAYAIITAMGPTYFWPQWLKLKHLGQAFGLTPEELDSAIPHMLHGAIDLIYSSDISCEAAMDLIPVYPLKEEESTILEIFERRLSALHTKLTGS
jgi:pyrroline-5-carboxylate reductase